MLWKPATRMLGRGCPPRRVCTRRLFSVVGLSRPTTRLGWQRLSALPCVSICAACRTLRASPLPFVSSSTVADTARCADPLRRRRRRAVMYFALRRGLIVHTNASSVHIIVIAPTPGPAAHVHAHVAHRTSSMLPFLLSSPSPILRDNRRKQGRTDRSTRRSSSMLSVAGWRAASLPSRRGGGGGVAVRVAVRRPLPLIPLWRRGRGLMARAGGGSGSSSDGGAVAEQPARQPEGGQPSEDAEEGASGTVKVRTGWKPSSRVAHGVATADCAGVPDYFRMLRCCRRG
eukprot:280051-Chlamydomonas_euryale.AAC.5